MDFRAHVHAASRFSRRPRRLHARGVERRGCLLPLPETYAARRKTAVKTAVIVTTYNRPDALAAVLEGYRSQRDAEFELLIADDGSRDDTRLAVAAFKSHAGLPVTH